MVLYYQCLTVVVLGLPHFTGTPGLPGHACPSGIHNTFLALSLSIRASNPSLLAFLTQLCSSVQALYRSVFFSKFSSRLLSHSIFLSICYRLNYAPSSPNSQVEVLAPTTLEGNLFRYRVSKEIMMLKRGH